MERIVFPLEKSRFNSLHDCTASSIVLEENKLTFSFCSKGLTECFLKQGWSHLNVIFTLSGDFLDFDFVPPVRNIRIGRHLKKTTLKYYTLKEFAEHVNDKNYQLMFYSEYFNENKCLLILHPIKNGNPQIENEYNIELLIDEIIYEWE